MRIFRDPERDGDMPPRVRTFMATLGLGCFCCCIGLPGGGSRSGSRAVADVAVTQAPAVQAR